MSGTILQKIVETKRGEVAEARKLRPLALLMAEIQTAAAPRDFYNAVVGDGSSIRVIAEIKKASPSAGVIRADFDPVMIARSYETGGASALSILTDRTYFQGDPSFVKMVKQAVPLLVLRKDFMIDEYQIYESRAIGADAILLIAEILSVEQIEAWSRLAFSLGMSSLIEVHDEVQLRAVRHIIASEQKTMLGINNRDLRIQKTDINTTARLARELPSGIPFVSESGIQTRDDMMNVQKAGATAVLIGEGLLRAIDPGAKLRELLALK